MIHLEIIIFHLEIKIKNKLYKMIKIKINYYNMRNNNKLIKINLLTR